ncbi:MAG: Calx-beta domain-containing protein [Candidatus Eisenbacteria bacterium]|nr:Calx-beta domain-containing protein [Candidatus Eisenbacteria bacterium]
MLLNRRPFLFVATMATLVALFLPSMAAAVDEPIAGIPAAGAPGISETINQIMDRELNAPRLDTDGKDMESELVQPDRTGLPQNPASPKVEQMPELPPGFEGEAAPGISPFSPQTVGTSFTGATLFGTNPTFSLPPDGMGAIGPTQYVVFVNGRLVTFNKTTGIADGVLNADPNVFFSSVINGSSTSDPRIRYDRLTGRWFLVIINVSTPNRILLAVSDAASSGTISGGTVFTFFFIDISATPPAISNTCLADYPTLGLDNNALYIGTNNFCGSPQTFNSTDGYVVRKSSILGAGPIVLTVFRGLVATSASAGPYTPQGVDNNSPSANEGYFIGVDNATFGTLMMRRVSSPGGTPTISANISITTPSTSFPENVPHLGNTGGTNGRLSALDDRLFAAQIRNGRLWTAHNIEVNASGVASTTGSRNGSRWYELNVPVGTGTPTIVQSGTIFDPAATNAGYYWIPSVLVSGQGHAAFGMSHAGNNARANAATVGRLAGDALGTTQTPVLYTASATAYNPASDPGGSGGRRWGDYSYTSLDPIDDMTMWTVQEFCDATNSYGVRVAKLIAPPPATPSSIPDVTAGANPVNVTLTGLVVSGSGFYDPGANLPGVPAFNHLAVTISNGLATGTPPTVISATYVNPTTVSLVLNASAATASIGAERYRVTVINPDGQSVSGDILKVIGGTPSVSLAPAPIQPETNAGLASFNFTVNLSATTANPVTVNYQTSDGSATVADDDYVAATSFIIIPANTPSGIITISVKGDTKHEPLETFTLTLTGTTNATLGTPVAAAAGIQNDDAIPTIEIAPGVLLPEGNAGLSGTVLLVTLSNPSSSTVSASFQTSDGSAMISDGDYPSSMGQVSFPPGTVSAPIVVQATGDTKFENDETYLVTLSSPVNGTIGNAVGVVTIENDDVPPVISINDVQIAEGDAGITLFLFTVSLSEPSGLPASVDFTTNEGTATLANNDFNSLAGNLNFPPGLTSQPVGIHVNGDVTQESNETFTVDLSNLVGAQFGDPSGEGLILNDDGVPTIFIDSISANEGNAGPTLFQFSVTLSNPTDQTVMVQYQTNDVTATLADSDYLAASGTLTFPPKTLLQTVEVQVVGDICGESDEDFIVTLFNPSGAVIGAGAGLGMILNDDEDVDPSVAVLYPNAGEILQVGTDVTLQWNASDNNVVTGVDLLLSRDGGATFPEVLASNIPNTGSFLWTVTGPPSVIAEEVLLVRASDANCNVGSDVSDVPFQIVVPTSAVPGTVGISSLALGAIRPNPSRGATRIEFQVPREARIRISVVDLQGREVAILTDASFSPGRYETTWDGSTSRGPAAMGVYFVRAQGDGEVITQRLVISR